MKTPRIALAFLFLCCLASCKKEDNCINKSPWYQNDVKLTYRNAEPGMADNIHFFVTRVDKSKVITIDDIGVFAPVGAIEICGSKLYKASTQEYKDIQLYYDLNANVGDKWVVKTDYFGTSVTEAVTLKAKNVSITVPYGTFNVTEFEIDVETGYPFRYKFYVTDDHGPIKLTGNGTDSAVNLELQERNF